MTTDPTPERLAEIRERRWCLWPDGPWAIWTDLTDGGFIHVGNVDGVIPDGEIATPEGAEAQPIAQVYTPELAEFIAAAPTDIADLIAWGEGLAAEVKRLRTQRLSALRELLNFGPNLHHVARRSAAAALGAVDPESRAQALDDIVALERGDFDD